MRLKEYEISSIIQSFEEVFLKNNLSLEGSALYLYGSRTKDHLRGGDIDLLLRVPKEILKSVKSLDYLFSRAIQDKIGEQKIDILIIDTEAPKHPFHEIAIEQAVLIKQW